MKSALLSFLLFGGFLALTRCDKMLCLVDTVELCAVTLRSINEICVSGATTCLKNALKTCEVHDAADIDAFLGVMTQICTTDSELNKKFVKHRDCLTKTFDNVETISCADEIIDESKHIGPTSENMLKFIGKLCDAAPKSLPCFYGKIEASCSKEAKDLLSDVVSPVMKLFQKSCEELTGGGAHILRAFSWMLFATIALPMLFATISLPMLTW